MCMRQRLLEPVESVDDCGEKSNSLTTFFIFLTDLEQHAPFMLGASYVNFMYGTAHTHKKRKWMSCSRCIQEVIPRLE